MNMLNPATLPLLLGALAVGALHTIAGPDHYLPFIALGRARNWGLARTCWITFYCGLGHILSSVLLGLVGLGLGYGLQEVMAVETLRGDWAAWGMLLLGLVYLVWGLRRAYRSRKGHHHAHYHADGHQHQHLHQHASGTLAVHAHAHPHPSAESPALSTTGWALFIIFVLGPCEPLIPILSVPLLRLDGALTALLSLAYGAATLLVMQGMVIASYYGLRHLKFERLEAYLHPLAGGVVSLTAVGMIWLGY